MVGGGFWEVELGGYLHPGNRICGPMGACNLPGQETWGSQPLLLYWQATWRAPLVQATPTLSRLSPNLIIRLKSLAIHSKHKMVLVSSMREGTRQSNEQSRWLMQFCQAMTSPVGLKFPAKPTKHSLTLCPEKYTSMDSSSYFILAFCLCLFCKASRRKLTDSRGLCRVEGFASARSHSHPEREDPWEGVLAGKS